MSNRCATALGVLGETGNADEPGAAAATSRCWLAGVGDPLSDHGTRTG